VPSKPPYQRVVVIFLCLPCLIHAAALNKQLGPHEFYLEFTDPYYAATGLYFSLSGRPMPNLDTSSENDVYAFLIQNALRPTFFLAEIGVFPLPCAGVAAKKWHRDLYDKSAIDSINIIRTITESVNFREPWSVSAFVGNVVKFRPRRGGFEGTGNIGLLASYGNYHIKGNDLYPDHWGEFELKLKVDKSGGKNRFGTSYRIGTRIHSHEDIRNVLYLSFARNRTDFEKGGSWLVRNTDFQIRTDCSTDPLEILTLTIEAGKKFPFSVLGHNFAAGLCLGFTGTFNNPYTGEPGQGFRTDTFSPIIKPLIRF
jgi:hypothetical protein